MTDGKKLTDAALGLGGIALDLATQNYAAAALQVLAVTKDFALAATERKFGSWFKGIAESKTWGTPQEVQGLIEAKIKDSPEAKESVWAAAKAVLDAISDRAAEVIGSITAEYVRDKKGPDPFFRGAVRVLADVSAEELETLKQLVHLGAAGKAPSVKLTNKDRVLTREPLVAGHQDIRLSVDEEARVSRLFRLLKTYDLGHDAPAGKWGMQSGPHIIVFELADLGRLSSHL